MILGIFFNERRVADSGGKNHFDEHDSMEKAVRVSEAPSLCLLDLPDELLLGILSSVPTAVGYAHFRQTCRRIASLEDACLRENMMTRFARRTRLPPLAPPKHYYYACYDTRSCDLFPAWDQPPFTVDWLVVFEDRLPDGTPHGMRTVYFGEREDGTPGPVYEECRFRAGKRTGTREIFRAEILGEQGGLVYTCDYDDEGRKHGEETDLWVQASYQGDWDELREEVRYWVHGKETERRMYTQRIGKDAPYEERGPRRLCLVEPVVKGSVHGIVREIEYPPATDDPVDLDRPTFETVQYVYKDEPEGVACRYSLVFPSVGCGEPVLKLENTKYWAYGGQYGKLSEMIDEMCVDDPEPHCWLSISRRQLMDAEPSVLAWLADACLWECRRFSGGVVSLTWIPPSRYDPEHLDELASRNEPHPCHWRPSALLSS